MIFFFSFLGFCVLPKIRDWLAWGYPGWWQLQCLPSVRLPVDPTGVRRQNRLQEGGLLKRDSPSQTVPRTPKHCPTQRSPTGKGLHHSLGRITNHPKSKLNFIIGQNKVGKGPLKKEFTQFLLYLNPPGKNGTAKNGTARLILGPWEGIKTSSLFFINSLSECKKMNT